MNIHDELLTILNELGIIIKENGEFDNIDSITFITLIIRIEDTFGIMFPDDLLIGSVVKNVDNLETIITNIILNGD